MGFMQNQRDTFDLSNFDPVAVSAVLVIAALGLYAVIKSAMNFFG